MRIPHYYIPSSLLLRVHAYTHFLLPIIRDIHLDIANQCHWNRNVRHYQYYPSFLIWVHDKAVTELTSRGVNHKSPLDETIRKLKSRSLSYFLPPTANEIAEDVVYMLEHCKKHFSESGRKLPLSYLTLARDTYGYSPNETSLQRVEQVSGHHYHNDSGWYYI